VASGRYLQFCEFTESLFGQNPIAINVRQEGQEEREKGEERKRERKCDIRTGIHAESGISTQILDR